jgi:pimeloyl-ACP methyl ester carboxylesterase
MRSRRLTIAIAIVATLAATTMLIAWSQLPAVGAGMLLYPARHVSTRATPEGCVDRVFAGVGAKLAGWVCAAGSAAELPAIVYLHGIGDNRDSSTGVIDRFVHRGFSVIVYDSRGHGRSEGDRCTYGFFEKQDLRLVLDQAGVDRAILIGHSLGAAVALQEAAIDPRIRAVVAASTFADLRSIAVERAPFVFTPALIAAAFARAEHDAEFIVDEVSPVRAAANLTIPVLVIHGARDRDTLPVNSERVFAALAGPKRLLIIPNAAHNDVLRGDVWIAIERWIDTFR